MRHFEMHPGNRACTYSFIFSLNLLPRYYLPLSLRSFEAIVNPNFSFQNFITMKSIKSSALALFTALFAFLIPQLSHGQNWDAQQQEVWKNVVAYNDLFAKGKVDAFMNYFTPEYSDWSYEKAQPQGKSDLQKDITSFFNDGNKITSYTLTPLAIDVDHDYAYVDYTINGTMVDKNGKTMTDKERWTDILMKRQGKWELIGDEGGQLDKLTMPDMSMQGSANWDSRQMEILNAEKSIMEAGKSNNLDALMSHYDEGYEDWSYASDKLHTKADVRKMLGDDMSKGNRLTDYQIMPYTIKAYPDFGFIHYLLNYTITDKDGKATKHTERWTDVWEKKDGKWVMIADHGGSVPGKKMDQTEENPND